MGILHPFSDEFPPAAAVVVGSLGRETDGSHSPPPSCCSEADYVEHEVSRMDTLAGIAIKYGVEISDIKRMNNLVSDRQMFAHKSLQIPLPGRHTPSPVKLNGSGGNTKRAWTPNHQPNKNTIDSFNSLKKSSPQRASLAMSTLQRYYGLQPQKGESIEVATEMASYGNGSFQRLGSEPFPKFSLASDAQNAGRHWNSGSPENGFPLQSGEFSENGIKSNGGTKAKSEVSVRRRQNTAEIQVDAAGPVKTEKSLFPRLISGIQLDMDVSSQSTVPNGNPLVVNGFHSMHKSSSTASLAEAENGTSIWSRSKRALKPEAFARPFLDGLPKPISVWRNKAALD